MTADTDFKAAFAFVSLGCPKNLVDSERMLGLLAQAGYAPTYEPADADLVIVNTCGFIDEARQESMGVIREMAALRREGAIRALIVAGCLAERQKEQLLDDVPEVDAVVGVFAREGIVAVCDALLEPEAERLAAFAPQDGPLAPETARLRLTVPHVAYLKISEGCDQRCTFCSIPLMRGPHRDKPLPEILAEAEELVGDGVRELCVIAQDTTAYGAKIDGGPRLADVLRALGEIRRLKWIRVLYAYPHHMDDALLDAMADTPAVVPYLDLPLQHINDRMLRRMGRRVTRAQTEELLGRLRERIPGVTIRTTLLAGFPGETDKEFEELLDFVREQRFERLGCFAYSLEPDTPAANMDGLPPEDVRAARRDAIMEAQQQIAFEQNRRMVGRTVELVVDEQDPERPEGWLARTPGHAPDIDGWVFLSGRSLHPGKFVRARVTRADGYDLWAATAHRTRRRRS